MLTYKFARFSEKLHEIKKILVRSGVPCLDPPLVKEIERREGQGSDILFDGLKYYITQQRLFTNCDGGMNCLVVYDKFTCSFVSESQLDLTEDLSCASP